MSGPVAKHDRPRLCYCGGLALAHCRLCQICKYQRTKDTKKAYQSRPDIKAKRQEYKRKMYGLDPQKYRDDERARYYRMTPEERRLKARESMQQQKAKLTDGVVAMLFRRRGLTGVAIPKDVIALYRALILTKRELRKAKANEQ